MAEATLIAIAFLLLVVVAMLMLVVGAIHRVADTLEDNKRRS